LHTLLTGEASGYYSDFGSLWHLAKAIAVGFVYDGQYSAFRNRRHGRALDPSLRNRLVAFLQNHDQIGNRAQGDRIHMLAGVERAKMGAALVLLGPFIPLLFQGEEWAASSPFQYFTNHSEPELARAVSEGRRREFAAFGWPPDQVPDPQDAQTFHRSRLKWSELADEPHRSMFDWYRKLIQFRREHAELTSAEASATFDETDRTFVMHRPGVDVICNFGAQDARVAQPEARQIVLASANFIWEAGELVVARDSVIVVSRTVPFGVHGSAADREPAVAEF
jgi:maltooligosyltrehalose trehalohydrolase